MPNSIFPKSPINIKAPIAKATRAIVMSAEEIAAKIDALSGRYTRSDGTGIGTSTLAALLPITLLLGDNATTRTHSGGVDNLCG